MATAVRRLRAEYKTEEKLKLPSAMLEDPLAVDVDLPLACAIPAIAQYSSSSSTTTSVTSGGSTVQSTTVNNGTGTSISGSTGEGTVSASGVVVNPEADRGLLSQVVSGLAADPAMQGATIDVQVVGGRVTLNGVARDTSQAEDAKEIAQAVAGSANVVSNLTTSRQ